jgi:hypothetical protein
MKAAGLLALLLWQAAAQSGGTRAQSDAMRYERAIQVPAGAGESCAVLDAEIFPHAAPSFNDLRIFATQSGGAASVARSGWLREVPYAITMSQPVDAETGSARLLNLGDGLSAGASAGRKSARIVFDLEMPRRAYTDVTLDLDPLLHDFLATATVSGSELPGGRGNATSLGTFSLFDLASQRLSRDTTLPLQESTFRYLHVVLRVSPVAGSAVRFGSGMVLGAQVPPSREAETAYTTVAQTESVTNNGGSTVARFVVAPRTPIERVSIQLAPGFKGNFSRVVRVSALAELRAGSAAGSSGASQDGRASQQFEDDDERAPLAEVVFGSIRRVSIREDGREIRSEQLGVPAILGANLQRAAKVEVAIENGDAPPLPVVSVRLEMRQRKICFETPAGGSGLALFYGDSELDAPVYDYDRLFVASSKPLLAELGPERWNPRFRAPPTPVRTLAERHPELLWSALIVVICLLGVVALNSARNVGV